MREGLTQEQLAFNLGVSPQTISRWENGTTYPDIVMLPIIADYMPLKSLWPCIDDGDKDGVKALLCSALKNDENIDEYVDTLVDGFEGDIVSTTLYKNFKRLILHMEKVITVHL